MFEELLNWVNDNKEWAFSGIGITILLAVCGVIKFLFFKKEKLSASQMQTSGKNSINIQIGGDYNARKD